MADQDFARIRNISLKIFIVLVILLVVIYFTLSREMSLAIIISALLAFLLFVASLIYFRWVAHKSIHRVAKSVMLSFVIKLVFLGAALYLINRSGIGNPIVFGVSFIVFFMVFLNIEIFLIYKKLLFK